MPRVIEAIQKRRSVRKYLPHSVPHELVLEVLAAAGWAPSAHNSQPWRFIVISNTKIKRTLAEAMGEAWAADIVKDGLTVNEENRKERVERFANAPILILCCLTMEGLRKFPDIQRQGFERDLAMQSLGAAIQNLLLAAYSQKLVSCWFCAPGFCKQTVREVLKIPDDIEPQSFVILGYAGECPPNPTKKKLTEYCYLDLWGKPLK
jgi:coenzyme F420-0:L-glutamate ligase / coenzyme F420-1:gamma-L-glutamate ligase